MRLHMQEGVARASMRALGGSVGGFGVAALGVALASYETPLSQHRSFPLTPVVSTEGKRADKLGGSKLCCKQTKFVHHNMLSPLWPASSCACNVS